MTTAYAEVFALKTIFYMYSPVSFDFYCIHTNVSKFGPKSLKFIAFTFQVPSAI